MCSFWYPSPTSRCTGSWGTSEPDRTGCDSPQMGDRLCGFSAAGPRTLLRRCTRLVRWSPNGDPRTRRCGAPRFKSPRRLLRSLAVEGSHQPRPAGIWPTITRGGMRAVEEHRAGGEIGASNRDRAGDLQGHNLAMGSNLNKLACTNRAQNRRTGAEHRENGHSGEHRTITISCHDGELADSDICQRS
jgi:hypothetical protein